MSSIRWLNCKKIQPDRVSVYLQQSIDSNQFTNGGPCVKLLEKRVHDLLHVEDTKAVIVVNNGATALHALVSALEISRGRALRFATQSYTFPVSVQGPLRGALIVDIDEGGGPDLSNIPQDNIDGIIVTNVLGHVVDLDRYEKWAEKYNKILLLDNAATSGSFYNGRNSINYGIGSIISFHHTKPIGFGEGGAIIVNREHERNVRNVINFGYDMVKLDQIWLPEGSNYKMSDIAATYILQYFDDFVIIKEKHQRLYDRFLTGLSKMRGASPFPNFSSSVPFVSCMPAIFEVPISLDVFKDRNIEAKKYYKPLTLEGKALDLYQRIVCFPCHIDMTDENVDYILTCIHDAIGE